MLFNIISWVCIILVILYVIGLIVVIIITDTDKKSFCDMTSPLWLPIFKHSLNYSKEKTSKRDLKSLFFKKISINY